MSSPLRPSVSPAGRRCTQPRPIRACTSGELRQQIELIQREIEMTKEALLVAENKMKGEIESTEAATADATRQIEAITKETNELTAQVQRLTGEVQAKEAELLTLHTSNEIETEHLREEIIELREATGRERQARAQLSPQTAALNDSLNDQFLDEQIRNLESEIEEEYSRMDQDESIAAWRQRANESYNASACARAGPSVSAPGRTGQSPQARPQLSPVSEEAAYQSPRSLPSQRPVTPTMSPNGSPNLMNFSRGPQRPGTCGGPPATPRNLRNTLPPRPEQMYGFHGYQNTSLPQTTSSPNLISPFAGRTSPARSIGGRDGIQFSPAPDMMSFTNPSGDRPVSAGTCPRNAADLRGTLGRPMYPPNWNVHNLGQARPESDQMGTWARSPPRQYSPAENMMGFTPISPFSGGINQYGSPPQFDDMSFATPPSFTSTPGRLSQFGTPASFRDMSFPTPPSITSSPGGLSRFGSPPPFDELSFQASPGGPRSCGAQSTPAPRTPDMIQFSPRDMMQFSPPDMMQFSPRDMMQFSSPDMIQFSPDNRSPAKPTNLRGNLGRPMYQPNWNTNNLTPPKPESNPMGPWTCGRSPPRYVAGQDMVRFSPGGPPQPSTPPPLQRVNVQTPQSFTMSPGGLSQFGSPTSFRDMSYGTPPSFTSSPGGLSQFGTPGSFRDMSFQSPPQFASTPTQRASPSFHNTFTSSPGGLSQIGSPPPFQDMSYTSTPCGR